MIKIRYFHFYQKCRYSKIFNKKINKFETNLNEAENQYWKNEIYLL